MGELHFLRPWWLVLLPVGAWLIVRLLGARAASGGWQNVVAPELRAYVLVEPETLREGRSALAAALIAWALGIVALAGPAWERLPVPAFRSDEALVVALDLSRSMDAADVEPSRVARAKLKLLDLLERRSAGQTALVVFSTHAFTVTPLTSDTRAIASLVGSIQTDIMPTHGGTLAAGLDKARGLLRQTGLSAGEVLLLTDSEVTSADVDLAAELRDDGYTVSVLAVGTEQGAPIPQAEGGFVDDANGNVVVPRVDVPALERVAEAGGGRFAVLSPDDRDLDALFPPQTALAEDAVLDTDSEQRYEADVWLDRGPYLALLLLPLLALCFRRGWLLVLPLVLALPLRPAAAFEWSELWQRADQRGYEALQADEPERAAELFEDPAWRGAAQYRAGAFGESAATLSGADDAEAHYNRGNALAKAGKLEEAIAEYDRALEQAPGHEDALYNRDLVKEYLAQNPPPPPQQQPQSGDQGDEGEQNEQGEREPQDSSGEQQEGEAADEGQKSGEQGEQGESQAQSDGTRGDEQAGGDEQSGADDSAQADAEQPAAQDGEPPAEAPSSKDVEQWASEQAAEQWLRRVPQDPGGLLRRKFLYQYQRLGVDQDGNAVLPNGAETKPW